MNLCLEASSLFLTYDTFLICTNSTYQLNSLNVLLTTVRHGSSTAIQQGLGQANVLAVVTTSTSLDLYVNGVHLSSVSSSKSANTGQIGIIVGSLTSSSTSAAAAFNDAKLWTL